MRIYKVLFKIFIGFILAFVLIALINFIPTIRLANSTMSVFVGDWVNVYYETEKEAARDAFELAEERARELAELLGLTEKENIRIYIYDKQRTMQTKKYGYIVPFLGLDWHIGDNISTDVILTSPANPGKAHDYNSVKNAVLHEIVHAYNHVLNEDMTYWVDNGLAGYLSGQNPGDIKRYGTIPTLEQTRIKGLTAPIKFADFNGYQYSYSYIEYLDNTYSWDSIKAFAQAGDYEAAFGASEEDIYNGWLRYITD
ncbi:MAG: hypothetical protein GX129_05760 [Clostridiales bacterium]|jgi:hypothetical protein|nr:hypothetical protein [Clostridiales bacterium]